MMNHKAWVTSLAIGAACMIGCERNDPRKAIVLNPTTRQTPPAVSIKPPVEVTTQPATTQTVRAISQMTINGVLYDFPEAKLIVRKDGERLSAFLVSNDPPEVINPKYQGNRYYFEMKLDAIDDIKNLAIAEFRYKAASAEPQDTPNGIFLDGDRQHLEPYDIQVVFDKEGDHLIADIRGQFLYFPKGNIVGTWVPVMAQLSAKPVVK